MTDFIDANIFLKRWSDLKVEKFINSLDRDKHKTSVLVLAEVSHKLENKQVKNTFEYIRDIMGKIEVLDVTRNDLFQALKNQTPIGVNDRIHLAVMKRNNIHAIISFDKDFDKDKTIKRIEP